MRRACIDIGSNTTRLLVAECDGEQLHEIHQERVFTRIGTSIRADGSVGPDTVAQVAETVVSQLRSARELGAVDIRAVATAAVRRASNRAELLAAIDSACGLAIEILATEEEARLAFVGAAGTLDHVPSGAIGVVDVGGGSSELVVGTAPDRVSWCASFELGSGDLAARFLRSDPPSATEMSRARDHVTAALGGAAVPQPVEAVAVGGSATSLRRFAGPRLDAAAFTRSLGLLAGERAADLARRFALDPERVRLLPAGLMILQGASERFGVALDIGRGGLREGVLLEAGRPARGSAS